MNRSGFKLSKQIGFIQKTQVQDNLSINSNSRSSVSYQFNQSRFSKSKIQKEKSQHKPFKLNTIAKAKQTHQQTYKNQSRYVSLVSRKISKTESFDSLLDRQPIIPTLKSSTNQKIQIKLKKFLINIRKMHSNLKSLAQNMITTFEQLKQDMQKNLIQVTNQICKINGQLKSVNKIQQIIHQGFQKIKKNIVLPLQSLSNLNQSPSQILQPKSVKYNPMTPLAKSQPYIEGKPINKFNQVFSSQLIGGQITGLKLSRLNMKQPQKGKPKMRAQTQRRRKQQTNLYQKEPQQTTQRKRQQPLSFRSTQSTSNIQNIINQMRQILKE